MSCPGARPLYLTLAEPVWVEREPRRKPVLERVQPRLDALLEGVVGAHDGEAAADGDEAAPPATRGGLRLTPAPRSGYRTASTRVHRCAP